VVAAVAKSVVIIRTLKVHDPVELILSLLAQGETPEGILQDEIIV
jgi:hypothetical protein